MSHAFDPAASAFLNALLREWTGWRVLASAEAPDLAGARAPRVIEIRLRSRSAVLYVGALSLSRAGRHRLVFPVHLREREGRVRAISFAELVALVVAEEGIVGRVTQESAQRFMVRVLASARNIAMNLEERAGDIERIFSAPLGFIEAEQALLTGHAIHPTPKARDGLADADARRYAPELGRGFPLRWYAVRRERCLARSVTPEPAEAIVMQLFDDDPALSTDLLRAMPHGHVLLPAHPWQAAHWTASEAGRRAVARGDLIDLGEAGSPWAATSSLRTVHAPHARWMLKFSASVRLTNSLRTLRIPELERGLLLSRVPETPRGRELGRRHPRLSVLREPLYLGLRADDGSAIEDSTVAFRDNPFRGAGKPNTYVLAALLQDHPQRGQTRLSHHVTELARAERRAPAEVAVRWLRAFLAVVLEPLLVAQADYGILLSAHQQNLVVRLGAGYPDFTWFRDCQGTAYTALARDLFGRDVEGLDAHTFDGDRGSFFFSYSVIINAVFGVLSALAMDDVAGEEDLLVELRRFLVELRSRPLGDRSCLDYLLDSPRLWSKGNFFCCLREINETTIDDPLLIYHEVANPLHAPTSS